MKNVAYFGRTENLDPLLRGKDWAETLESRGLAWQTIPLDRWHDYSQVDLTVSVRRFGDAHVVASPVATSESKPPSKLINSWLAGVPAIVGDESAYRLVRRSELDFIKVRSHEELMAAIDRIQMTPSLYEDMVRNGRERAKEFDNQAITSRWIDMFEHEVAPRYRAWLKDSVWRRRATAWKSYFSYWTKPVNLDSAFRGYFRA